MTASFCLAMILYFEARGEPIDGKLAVADVVLSRADSNKWPDEICKVMKQEKQFSFYTDSLEILDVNVFRSMETIASHVIGGYKPQIVQADHYHTVDVNPSWNKDMKLVRIIGKHKFYSSK